MSSTQNKTIARKFVEEVFNSRNTANANNFVASDVVYHGMGEEVRSLDKFKQWVQEDLSAFPDMKVTLVDDVADKDKVALRWILQATHERDFGGFPASHRKFEAQGVEFFRFEGDRIKEAWTTCDMSALL